MAARSQLSGQKLPPTASASGAATTLPDGTLLWSVTSSMAVVATAGALSPLGTPAVQAITSGRVVAINRNNIQP